MIQVVKIWKKHTHVLQSQLSAFAFGIPIRIHYLINLFAGFAVTRLQFVFLFQHRKLLHMQIAIGMLLKELLKNLPGEENRVQRYSFVFLTLHFKGIHNNHFVLLFQLEILEQKVVSQTSLEALYFPQQVLIQKTFPLIRDQ